MASNGSLPPRLCSLRAVSVSTSSTKTHTKVSGSSSSMVSMLLNILATSFPLSLKNLLPSECALISTSLLCGKCLPRRIASFCANARLNLSVSCSFLLVFYYSYQRLVFPVPGGPYNRTSRFQLIVQTFSFLQEKATMSVNIIRKTGTMDLRIRETALNRFAGIGSSKSNLMSF